MAYQLKNLQHPSGIWWIDLKWGSLSWSDLESSSTISSLDRLRGFFFFFLLLLFGENMLESQFSFSCSSSLLSRCDSWWDGSSFLNMVAFPKSPNYSKIWKVKFRRSNHDGFISLKGKLWFFHLMIWKYWKVSHLFLIK